MRHFFIDRVRVLFLRRRGEVELLGRTHHDLRLRQWSRLGIHLVDASFCQTSAFCLVNGVIRANSYLDV